MSRKHEYLTAETGSSEKRVYRFGLVEVPVPPSSNGTPYLHTCPRGSSVGGQLLVFTQLTLGSDREFTETITSVVRVSETGSPSPEESQFPKGTHLRKTVGRNVQNQRIEKV